MEQAPRRRNSDSTAFLLLNESAAGAAAAAAAGAVRGADALNTPFSPSTTGGNRPNSPPQPASIVDINRNNPFASPMLSPTSPRSTTSPFARSTTTTSPKVAAAFESAFADLFPEPSPSTAVALQQELAAQAARVARLESELARATAKAPEALPPPSSSSGSSSGATEADGHSSSSSSSSSPKSGQSAASLAMQAELNAERKRSERLATEHRERNNFETALARDKAKVIAKWRSKWGNARAEIWMDVN